MKYCLTLLFAATAAFAVRAETVDYIRAIVGDSVITGQQITRNVSDEIQRRGQAPDTENAAQAIWTANYQDMLRRRVVLQDFKKLEKEKNAKIPENLVNDEVEHRIKQAFSGDRVRFDKWLQANGMTRQDFHDEVRDDIVVEEMRHEFVPTPIVSPHQIQAFYDQNHEKFTVAERIKFRWIAMNKPPDETNGVTRKKMEEVLTLLKGGANFDDLVCRKTRAAIPSACNGTPTGWRRTRSTRHTVMPSANSSPANAAM